MVYEEDGRPVESGKGRVTGGRDGTVVGRLDGERVTDREDGRDEEGEYAERRGGWMIGRRSRIRQEGRTRGRRRKEGGVRRRVAKGAVPEKGEEKKRRIK
jgi:hypothetical protein